MKKEIKDTLLNSLLDDPYNLPIEDGSLLVPEKNIDIKPFELEEKQQKSASKARRLVTTMLKLLSEDDVLEKSDYLKAKRRIDAMSLYQIFMSIEQLEHVLQRLMDEIDNGNTNSRIFEVFGNLQRTKLDMIKEGSLFIMQMEDSVKRLTLEQKNKMPISEKGAAEDGFKFRGAKGLMQIIQQSNKPVEDAKTNIEEK
jgi:hypothetical protein